MRFMSKVIQSIFQSLYIHSMNWRVIVTVLVIITGAVGCKKNHADSGNLQLKLTYRIDSKQLEFDTMLYVCDAGYDYEVTRLNYYLSGFVFSMQDGSSYSSNKVFYIDARQASMNTISFEKFPSGTCTQINFSVGLDSVKNQTDSLPMTFDNINMGWPDMMGGGYHFMKLEGHYRDSSINYGFAMHLGKNKNLVTVTVGNPVIVRDGNAAEATLCMNINEWLRNPLIYDFKTDGSYSMNNDTAMHKLCTNGTDIFN